MRLIKRLRRWCAQPFLTELQGAHNIEVASLKLAMSAASLQALVDQRVAYNNGRMLGEHEGRNTAFNDIQAVIDERHGLDAAQADLDRLRRPH